MSNPNLETALNTLKFLHPDGGVFELCLINPLVPTSPNWKGKAFGKKPLVAGWFRDQSKAVNLATRNDAEGIYTTLNQVNEALLARADHKLKANVDRTADDHIDRIQNLLVDIDPIRPAGISSTDSEHQAALDMAQIIRGDLDKQGWPDPLVGDSGNGAHLVYPLDLPRTNETKALLKAVLAGLARRYADQLSHLHLELDQVVFNPARLTKLYGTMTRKGDSTADRPHRLARIISLPEVRLHVPVHLLQKIAQEAGAEKAPRPLTSENAHGQLDVAAYLANYGVNLVNVKPHGDGTLYCLGACVFDPSHSGGESAIGQGLDGKLFYKCFHNSCSGRTWAEARTTISGQDKLTEFIIGAAHVKNSSTGQASEIPPASPPNALAGGCSTFPTHPLPLGSAARRHCR